MHIYSNFICILTHIHRLTPIFFFIFLYSFYIPLFSETGHRLTRTQLLRLRMICKRRICSCAGVVGAMELRKIGKQTWKLGETLGEIFCLTVRCLSFFCLEFFVVDYWLSVNLFGIWNLSWSIEIVFIFVFGNDIQVNRMWWPKTVVEKVWIVLPKF